MAFAPLILRSFPFFVAVSLALATTGAARADAPAPSRITARPSSCRALPWSEGAWIDLLRVELAADHIRVDASSDPADPALPRVTLDPIRCEGAADSATLVLTRGDVRSTRDVALTDVPLEARSRVLAIAMAELVREGLAARNDAPPLPAPEAQVAHLAVDVHVRADPPPPANVPIEPLPPAFSLFAAAEARAFPSSPTGLFGGRAGARFAPFRIFAVDLDAGALFGTTRDPLGDVDGTLASIGASLLATSDRAHGARAWFGVGPRVEAGVAIFHGQALAAPTTASTARGPVVLVALTSVAAFRVAPSLSAFAALDAGTSLLGYAARADDREVSAFEGAMLSIRIGFAFHP